MNLRLTVLSITTVSLLSAAAHAATVSGTFDVNLTLTSACQVTGTNPIAVAYDSFGVEKVASSNFTVRCTNTLPYGMALDQASTTDDVLQLNYTTALSAASSVGTGANQTFQATVTVPADQAGTCSVASCNNALSTNKTRTLTITY